MEWSLGGLAVREIICQEAMLGYPWLWVNHLGAYRAAQVWETSVWGVVWMGRFPEEESGELLWSDWLSSSSDAPCKCQARSLTGCFRHPGGDCARTGWGPWDHPVDLPVGVKCRTSRLAALGRAGCSERMCWAGPACRAAGVLVRCVPCRGGPPERWWVSGWLGWPQSGSLDA